MGTLTLRLTDQEDRDLQLACQQTGKTKSEVVRDLLSQTLHSYRFRQTLQSAYAELEFQTHCQPRNTSANCSQAQRFEIGTAFHMSTGICPPEDLAGEEDE